MVVPLGLVVAGGGVVVVTGEGVVVEAKIIYNHFNDTFTSDSPVTSVVTVASPVTTAMNPLAVNNESVMNLTVMVVLVTYMGSSKVQ